MALSASPSESSSEEDGNPVGALMDAMQKRMSQRTGPREMARNTPHETGVVKRGPSVEYMQKVSSLSMYNNMLGGDDMSDCLTDCLRAPGCSDAVIGLREASVKALATVQDMTCAEESLQEEVEAVHKALGRALRLSAEKGTGKREYKRFSKEEHVGADSMLDYNERSFPFFICMNAMSILIISEAATRALEMGSLKDGEPQYKRSYRSESDSDPDSI